MLTYWTRQYLLVLLGSLLILAVISGIWLRINAYTQIYNLLELRAEQLAELYGQNMRESVFSERLRQFEANRPRFAGHLEVVYIVDAAGNVQAVKRERGPAAGPAVGPAAARLSPLHQNVLAGQKIRDKFEADDQTWLRVGVPIYEDGEISKALYISTPARGVLLQVGRLYGSLALLTGIITLAGWFVLYTLSRRLTSPLREIAAAARSIAGGKYDPALPRQVKEEELQQLVLSFQDMASQLKQLEQLRTDLLAGVSHELRTPITSIRGMIQAVQNKVVTGREAEEFLQISLNEARRLQQMVEELLDFSSFEAGAAPIQKELVDLSHLVGEATRQLKASPEFSGVRFEPDLPVEPLWVKGDGGRLRQIVFNLFNNSQKASATLIKINLRAEARRVVLDVWDNGKGIASEDRPYIFERFYRGAAGQAGKRGLGLGLTLSRLLARAHAGDLDLLQTSADGTTFRLWLPRAM